MSFGAFSYYSNWEKWTLITVSISLSMKGFPFSLFLAKGRFERPAYLSMWIYDLLWPVIWSFSPEAKHPILKQEVGNARALPACLLPSAVASCTCVRPQSGALLTWTGHKHVWKKKNVSNPLSFLKLFMTAALFGIPWLKQSLKY